MSARRRLPGAQPLRWGAAAVVGIALSVATIAVDAQAETRTRYVTEELIVGVYSQPDLAGDRVGQVRSAEAVELLASEGEAAQIRTDDGLEGWVKESYLQSDTPLAARLAALQSEHDKLRKANASNPKVDAKALQGEIAELRTALETANRRNAELQTPAPASERLPDEEPVEAARPARNDGLRTSLLVLLVTLVAAAAGFGAGYYTLDRRIRAKYGGLKVY